MLDDAAIARHCGDDNEIVAELAREVGRLREGIRNHQRQTGHSLCWLNDVELWKLLDENPQYPHQTLPVREEFLRNCQRYYESRLSGTPWQDPNADRMIGQLGPVDEG